MHILKRCWNIVENLWYCGRHRVIPVAECESWRAVSTAALAASRVEDPELDHVSAVMMTY